MSERKDAIRRHMISAHEDTWPVLTSLQPGDLVAPVYGDGDSLWTVRELLGHLADAEGGLLGQVTRLVAGEVTVREDFDLARWNRSAVRKRAGLEMSELLDQINTAFQEALDFLEQVDEASLDLQGRHASGQSLTGEGFLRRIADHRREHVSDIRRALER